MMTSHLSAWPLSVDLIYRRHRRGRLAGDGRERKDCRREDASAADGIQRLCDTGVEIRLGRFLETVSGAGVSRYFCDDEIRRDDDRRRPVSDDGESTVSQGYSGRTAG